MKKIFLITMAVFLCLFITGCMHSNDNIKFKEDYESLNGKINANNKEYRTITIDEDNPFIYQSLKQINKRIENKETFIVYFGANWCPWCRSMLNVAISEAHEKNIKEIYYVDVRPNNDEDKDIRDIYDIKDGTIYLSHKGTKAYHKFLEYADNVLEEYESHGISVKDTKYEGEKRVGAPSFILIKNGMVTKLETGISEKETDPYMSLTDEITKDMENKFDSLYSEYLSK